MFLRNPFYESHHFTLHLTQDRINQTRKALLHHHDISPTKDHYSSGVQIQINNPPMSSKGRTIGHMFRSRQIKHFFSNMDFRAIYDSSARPKHMSSTNTPVLTRVLVSQKKLDHVQFIGINVEEVEDFPLLGQKPIPSTIEEVAAPEQFCKKDERKERKQKTKKAVNYLRNLGNSLKACYKKCSLPGSPLSKSLDGVTSFGGSESETRESKRSGSIHSVKLIKHTDKLKGLHKDIISKEKSTLADNVTKEIKKKVNVEAKKETKKKRKRHHTTVSSSSGLTFAEKMELLAMGPILN